MGRLANQLDIRLNYRQKEKILMVYFTLGTKEDDMKIVVRLDLFREGGLWHLFRGMTTEPWTMKAGRLSEEAEMVLRNILAKNSRGPARPYYYFTKDVAAIVKSITKQVFVRASTCKAMLEVV